MIENDPSGRTLPIVKSGENVGTITMTLMFLSLQEFRNVGNSEDGFDTADLDTAESLLTYSHYTF